MRRWREASVLDYADRVSAIDLGADLNLLGELKCLNVPDGIVQKAKTKLVRLYEDEKKEKKTQSIHIISAIPGTWTQLLFNLENYLI